MIEGLTYIADFLEDQEERSLRSQLDQLTYYHDTFRGRQLKRSYAQFGYGYRSTGRKLTPAAPFPAFLAELVEKVLPFSSPDEPVNQCIIAHYPRGAGIGWHTDAHSFGDCIIGVTVAGEARLQFRSNGNETAEYELSLGQGSLYSMRGPARWDHQHRIVPVKADRRSLTLRHARYDLDKQTAARDKNRGAEKNSNHDTDDL